MPDTTQDNAVYKQLSAEMRDGLKNIYQQAAHASSQDLATDALFNEASVQLDEVVRATENAAMSIMEIVEKQMESSQKARTFLQSLQKKYADDPDIAALQTLNNELEQDLTIVLTTLSFQDIAGQRIKKVMNALQTIENSVLELYLASGLIMEGAEQDPTRDAESLKADAQKAVNEFHETRQTGSPLKGPDKNGCKQSAIDDMLAQLGY